MPDPSDQLRAAGYALERCFDLLTSRLRARVGRRRDLFLLPYLSYGTQEKLLIRGRVYRETKAPAISDENLWTHLLATYRRISSVEVPHARVRATCGSAVAETVTDEEGFFTCELRHSEPQALWHDVQCEVLEPTANELVTAVGRVLAPVQGSKFGIISDIDDTIMVSHATNLARLAKSVFLQHVRERIAFPGVAAFYQALCGTPEFGGNPIFYVSSGPWNLYDIIIDFLELNAIPLGPVLLQDYGFDRQKFFCSSHSEHKLARIGEIMQTYPDLPFVLIGDSGQHDAEIYRTVLDQAPNRIRAIYIRDVSGEARDAEVRALAERVTERGGELLLVRDSLEAATHAASIGLIGAEQLPAIAAAVKSEGPA